MLEVFPRFSAMSFQRVIDRCNALRVAEDRKRCHNIVDETHIWKWSRPSDMRSRTEGEGEATNKYKISLLNRRKPVTCCRDKLDMYMIRFILDLD